MIINGRRKQYRRQIKKDPRDTQELKQKNSVRHKLQTLPLEKARWTGQKASKGRAKSQKIVNKLVHHPIRHDNVFQFQNSIVESESKNTNHSSYLYGGFFSLFSRFL
jgi:hypothetical protein